VTSLALAIGLFVAAIGIVGIVAPPSLQAIARYSVTLLGLYVAAAARIAFGVILVRAAPASRAPKVLRLLGLIALVGGLITPFIGVDRARAISDWWSTQGPLVIRLWPALALVFGVFIAYAVKPERRAA
jgi:FtsH-binding integral membrane protein